MWGSYWSPYSMYGGVSLPTYSPSSEYLERVCDLLLLLSLFLPRLSLLAACVHFFIHHIVVACALSLCILPRAPPIDTRRLTLRTA